MLAESQYIELIEEQLTLDKFEKWLDNYRGDNTLVTILAQEEKDLGQTLPIAVYLNWTFMDSFDFQGYFEETDDSVIYFDDRLYCDIEVKFPSDLREYRDAFFHLSLIEPGDHIDKDYIQEAIEIAKMSRLLFANPFGINLIDVWEDGDDIPF